MWHWLSNQFVLTKLIRKFDNNIAKNDIRDVFQVRSAEKVVSYPLFWGAYENARP